MSSTRNPVALLLMVALTVLALGPAPAVQAASAKPQVYPPQARPFGHTYGEWAIRYVQWMLSIPGAENPLYDTSGAHCAVDQSGPVWYLADDDGGINVRTCTVPAGKALLVSPFWQEDSTVDGYGDTFEALQSYAKTDADAIVDSMTNLALTVDGVHVPSLLTRYRFKNLQFTFKYPADYLGGFQTGSGTSKAVADGFFVMFAPLAAGRHTLDLSYSGQVAGEVTYHLTIRR